jgi:uncharacterized protein (TIGR02099 family)
MTDHLAAREPAAPGTGLHRLADWLWRLLVALVVLLAVYVSLGHYLTSRVAAAQDWIVRGLNERLPFTVSVAGLGADWQAFSPEFSVQDLLIEQAEQGVAPVRVAAGRLRLDVPASLASGSLQMSQLEVRGLSLRARVDAQGTLVIEGFENSGGSGLQQWLETFLPRVERVALLDNAVTVSVAGVEHALRADLELTRVGNARALRARIDGPDLQAALYADGVGNPLKPLSWDGDVFVDIASEDLGQFGALWTALDWPVVIDGRAGAQFWLTRGDGDSRARMRLDSSGLSLRERDGAWSLPLDDLAFEAALAQRRNHWTLLAEDLHAERGDQVLDLARAQFDWWGSALRIRAEGLGLDSLPTLLAAAPGLPLGLRDVLPVLAPAGQLGALELRLDDLAQPASSWSLRALLDDVSVESWRGAPALAGVRGFLELGPGGGRLQLDAAPFAMHFPTVYREPMRYARAWGDIDLDWDDERLRLQSGPMRVEGGEGQAQALFAVDIPFRERVTGPEMELLAGLTDSTVAQRDKYLPYILPDPLLDWLDDSVLAGTVPRAGFVWRGSLRPRNFPHITVQLFLDTVDARLRFDPAWPVLEDLAATVWVDDGRTWARARSARIHATALPELMVRVLPQQGGAQLSVASALDGDAADAQRLLEDSALAGLTNHVFRGWRMHGPVSGRLALEIPLRAGPPQPQVDLQLRLDGVDAQVTELALPLTAIAGELRYRTDSGFSGSRARGELWGAPLTLDAAPAARDLADLHLSGRVAAASLRDWLQLPLLDFARGAAEVRGRLRVAADGAASLRLDSDLLGVALDVPRPFAKDATQALPLALTLPLRSDPVMDIDIGERLCLRLGFGAGELARLAAAVGGGEADLAGCDARYCLSGSVSELDLLAWRDFGTRYLGIGIGAAPEVPGTPGTAGSYRIDSLGVGELRAGERRLGAARVDLWGQGSAWQGAVEADWLQGSLSREDDTLQLLIEDLDIGRYQGADGAALDLAQLQRLLPSMRVAVLGLRRAEQPLGALSFQLESDFEGGGLYAADIEGELFGVNLAPREPGLLAWTPGPRGERSTLELDVGFADLGAVLAAMGYAPNLESDAGRASLRLSWPGAPTAYDSAAASGSLQLALRDGRLLESRPGALALVSFLNFAEILRGLSLAHMFESGIPFETAAASLRLRDGMLRIDELTIDGAASAFAFTGYSDLGEGQVDGELVVTLPVANNLPWVAALAGGPAVAAGVFVVSKVFEKQVNRMSSAVYEVSGPIEAPQVAFSRLFDDRPDARPGDPNSPLAFRDAPPP